MEISNSLENIITCAQILAYTCHTRLITPEHILLTALDEDNINLALQHISDIDVDEVRFKLRDYIDNMEKTPEGEEGDYELTYSYQFGEMMQLMELRRQSLGVSICDVPHLLDAIYRLPNSFAANCLKALVGQNNGDLLLSIIINYQHDIQAETHTNNNTQDDDIKAVYSPNDNPSWREYVLCINDHLKDHNPLIGREKELNRTIQILCRKDKNNPLHIGEPGVGKTSIVYGLAERIARGDVPKCLASSKIYQIDLGALIAGTQYRGEFEKRLKAIMKGVAEEPGAILYIDEMHQIVGAGQAGEGSMDASNLLKPYLEGGQIRFIGATTYQEYNRYIMRNHGLMRRFQQVPIDEPQPDEALKIIQMLKPAYEQYHHVVYDDDALELAVKGSARHVTDRFLPDKAIDLIDEAGAWIQMHQTDEKNRRVDKKLIAEILSQVAKVDALAMEEDNDQRLKTLEARIKSKIYGQDVAVQSIVESIHMSKAGLTDPNKPLASLLFVGPTGVGKTELARVLASELDVELVRFDMSEYVEKHTVAKLIGSPAGYVGYEDGGLLTDAVRKHPDCVLLLDEIEKAHDDIFNLLLQVMDYGVLSDNKGHKTVFHHVVLIMTSNAGAQFAHQASVGFSSTTTAGQAMLKQVKKTFKPEFINRLSSIVVFNDMDQNMANQILNKKLQELQQQLDHKHVVLEIGENAHNQLLKEGYSKQYGAREMDRVIQRQLKSRLVKEILFGALKQGGRCQINVLENGEWELTTNNAS